MGGLKEDVMEIYDVVKRLVGEIDPVGETNEDDRRYENLKVMTELVDKMLTDIDYVAQRGGSHMFSVSRAGKYASDFYTRIGIVD